MMNKNGTGSRSIQIPESTIYRKALRKMYARWCLIKPAITILCTMANKRYTYVLRISILLLKQLFII